MRPDLSAWSKSLANGYPLAALLGAEPYRDAAGRITATGSFWYAAAPMAAALTTIRILKEIDGIETMRAVGRAAAGGPARPGRRATASTSRSAARRQMPLLLFADDPEFAKVRAWSGACARHGVYLHPVHNWFVSTAHDEATIDEALTRTDQAFADVREALRGRLRKMSDASTTRPPRRSRRRVAGRSARAAWSSARPAT